MIEIKGYTPRPWLMNVKIKFLDSDGLVLTDGTDKIVCTVSHDLTQVTVDEYTANAELIAAAPELYEENARLREQVEVLRSALTGLYNFTLNKEGYLDVVLNDAEAAMSQTNQLNK